MITQGQPIFEVDGAPVYLFYGTRASWRTLTSGITAGPDVQQLEQNLTTLGYADSVQPDRRRIVHLGDERSDPALATRYRATGDRTGHPRSDRL